MPVLSSSPMRCWRALVRAAAMTAVVLSCSCETIGPRQVPNDRFDYADAIATSTRQELLANLVRLRYGESPVFLTVGSVITQYTQTASVNAALGANAGVSGDDTAAVGGSFRWAERPTITYVPLSGQEFADNLLTPLEPRAIFGLMQAGWSSELVTLSTVISINALDNEIARPARRRQAEPEFREFLLLWRRLLESGVLGIDFKSQDEAESDDDAGIVFDVRERPTDPDLARDLDRFFELLGHNPASEQLRITYGLIPSDPGQIAIMTHAVLDIMLNIAWQFDVPAEHIESGKTLETFYSAHRERAVVAVQHARERPPDSIAAVKQHGYWFYVDPNDYQSKRVLTFLEVLLSLAQTKPNAVGPVVTIPTG